MIRSLELSFLVEALSQLVVRLGAVQQRTVVDLSLVGQANTEGCCSASVHSFSVTWRQGVLTGVQRCMFISLRLWSAYRLEFLFFQDQTPLMVSVLTISELGTPCILVKSLGRLDVVSLFPSFVLSTSRPTLYNASADVADGVDVFTRENLVVNLHIQEKVSRIFCCIRHSIFPLSTG